MNVIQGTIRSGIGYDHTLVHNYQASFESVLGAAPFPGSLNVETDHPLKFTEYHLLNCGEKKRMYINACLNKLPVIISHRYPLRPKLRKRVLIFSTIKLRDALGLRDGSRVIIEIEDLYLGPVSNQDISLFFVHEVIQNIMKTYYSAKYYSFKRIKEIVGKGYNGK